MQYRLIVTNSYGAETATSQMNKDVAEFIGKGWRPYGNPAIETINSNFYIFQAVVKEDSGDVRPQLDAGATVG